MRRFGIAALLAALSIGFYWKLVLTDEYTWLDSPDMAYLEAPRLQFQAQLWHKLRFPLWDPHHWAGQPFLGQITGAADPLNWPLLLAGFRDGKIRQDLLHWHFVLGHWLAALLMYWFCRDRARSRTGALLAACVFSFGGYVGTSDWPQVLHGCLWTPAILLFLLRAAEGRQPAASAAMAGLFTGLSWLSGHHQAPYYLTLLVAVFWTWFILRDCSLSTVRLTAVSLLFTGLVSALQTLPGWEYGRLAIRWAGIERPLRWFDKVPAQVHEHFSLRLPDLGGIVAAGAQGHVSLFLGAAAFALAVIAVVSLWRDWTVRVLAMLALAGIVLAISEQNPLYGLLYGLVPWFEKARVPARIAFLFCAAAAALTAWGWDWLRAQQTKLLAAVLAGGAAILLLLAVALRLPQFALPALTLAALAALVEALRRGALTPHSACALAVLLVFFELAHVRDFTSRYREGHKSQWAELWRHRDIADFLRWQKGPVRVVVDDTEIPYNFGDWHGIDTLIGFTATAPANLASLEWHKPEVQDLLAVGYRVAREPLEGDREVFRGQSGVRVFERPSALPRARFETTSELCPPGTVTWQEIAPARLTLTATANCRSLLVVADTYFPGWVAEVDGRRTDISQVHRALRGLVLEKGTHQVRMVYQPWTVWCGALLTLIGIGGALILQRRALAP